ncbi:MAG: tripartite tricarboxylate transporter TctB family protein [Methyloligellaceae bacterium]
MAITRKIPWLGACVIAFAVFMLAIAIPYGVSAPSNVQTIVLSPKFWPIIIALALLLLGAMLVLQQFFSAPAGHLDAQAEDEAASTGEDSIAPWARLLAMAGLMAGLIVAIPKIGMVWASIACFALFAIIVRTPRLVASLIVAALLPLVLYGFFNHVAGVAVPQGEFVRLP